MTEIEELKEEIKRLRERVEQLEARPLPDPWSIRIGPKWTPADSLRIDSFPALIPPGTFPPGTITC